MRQFLFVPLLFACCFLTAQNKMPDYPQKQNSPPVQKPRPADCYVQKFDGGTSAFRRGDYAAALRMFEDAKTCPEALGSSRKLKELEARIEYCNAKLGRKTASGVATPGSAEKLTIASRTVQSIESTGRKFTISSALARNTDPNCFQLTVKEADRAFRDSCWDDAAKLYRAAKNCADANQVDRERMSNRIESCRTAAEDELLQKEQKAIRTARHALAANLADDAMDLLRQGDRSQAWRLADFANFYVAPDDNPDCLEAMYDAYLYEPPKNQTLVVHPPFCYQLSEDIGDDAQFRFSKSKEGDRLTAFMPQENKITFWELPSMKEESYSTEAIPNAVNFDISPDGSLVFIGYNYFYFVNGQALEVTDAERAKHCFSEDGETFFYEDMASGMVRSVNLNQTNRVQQQQQRKSPNSIGRRNQPPGAILIDKPLFDMKEYKDELWLAFEDRIEVLSKNKVTGAMTPRLTWHFMDTILKNLPVLTMNITPSSREAIVNIPGESYYYFLHMPQDDSSHVYVWAGNKIPVQLVAWSAGADTLLTVSLESVDDTGDEIMTVFNPDGGRYVSNRFYTRTKPYSTVFTVISEDGRWIVCQDGNRQTRLWSLLDAAPNPPVDFDSGYDSQFTPDGNHLVSKTPEGLSIFDADDIPGGALEEIETVVNPVFLPPVAANQWVVFLSAEKEIAIRHVITKQEFHFGVNESDNASLPYAFDNTEDRYFAYSPGNGMVLVNSLADQSSIASRYFGGQVTMIRAIPNSDKLLVVSKSNDVVRSRYTVKVWDFSKPAESPKVVRLQGYDVEFARVSQQGDRLALSNLTDIRIFSLDNLDNESVVIKPPQSAFISDMAFRPDGLAIVSGDREGNVGIWDVNNGQALLRFSNVWEGRNYPVERLAYSNDGSRLRLFSPRRLFTISLDAYTLRDIVQSQHKWLSAFTTDQIRDYNLEIAFKYSGNFDRLAESGDYPLIRSFFQYFRDQSISSNNIDQVRTYCERAYTLYQLLDATGQKNLEYTMFEMYEYYILKLLLRNNAEEATKVVMHLEKRFKRPSVAILSSAHCSLVRHDLKAASRLYTDYLLRLPNDGSFPEQLDKINTQLSQFQEYDLFDTTQVTCLCEVFQQFNNFEKLCPQEKKYATPSYSREAAIYQQIYHDMDSVLYSLNKNRKVKVLEHTLKIAEGLQYPNSAVENHPLEAVTIALSEAYLEQAVFEQYSPKKNVIYEKAITLLEKNGPFKNQPDTARLSHLVNAQLRWGEHLLELDKPMEASVHINAALQTAKKLGRFYSNDPRDEVGALDLSAAYIALCKAKLLEGKPGEARKAYEQANEFRHLQLNSTLLAYAALLENNDTEAFINFGGIKTAPEFAQVQFEINRMAELLPMHRVSLLAFLPRLQGAFLGLNQRISVTEIDYWKATYQEARFAAKNQWDSAYVWSTQAVKNSATLMQQPGQSAQWRNEWLDQQLNATYYLLNSRFADTSALSQIIKSTNDAMLYVAQSNQYYEYINYFNTNLAHSLWLRNRSGDREKAISTYKLFLANQDYDDTWELLMKDFRDLHRTGVVWPELRKLIEQIKPEGVELSQEEWREMGG